MSASSAKPQLRITRYAYTDSGHHDKVNLQIQLAGRFTNLSITNSAFVEAYDTLTDSVNTFVVDGAKGAMVTNLPSRRTISVTEIDTGRRNFGDFIERLIAHLRESYEVNLVEKNK